MIFGRFTSPIIIVFSGTLGAKQWILFMIITSIHLQFPQAIVSGSPHLDSSN